MAKGKKKISKFAGLFLWTVKYSYGSAGSRYTRSLSILTTRRDFEIARERAERWLKNSEYDDDMQITIDAVECEGTIDA